MKSYFPAVSRNSPTVPGNSPTVPGDKPDPQKNCYLNAAPLAPGWEKVQGQSEDYYNIVTRKTVNKPPVIPKGTHRSTAEKMRKILPKTSPTLNNELFLAVDISENQVLVQPRATYWPTESSALKKQSDVLQRYQDGAVTKRDVLIETSNVMKECSLPGRKECLERLIRNSITPDAYIYRALISACGDSGKPDLAVTYHNEMIDTWGILPNLHTYNALIAAFAKVGDTKGAEKCPDQMSSEWGIAPDVFTFASVIAAFAKVGDTKGAEKCHNEMSSKWGIEPNAHTCSAVIAAFAKFGDTKGAEKYHNEMSSKCGVKPDVYTYNALISVFAKVGDTKGAEKCLDEMKEKNIALEMITYSSVISAFANSSQTDQAEKVVNYLEEMKKKNIAPDLIVYNRVIAACVKCGKMELAESILKSGVDNRIYQLTLGYDKSENKLNLHVNSVYSPKTHDEHEQGVSSHMAKLLFYVHWKLRNIKLKTCIVVGSHGNNTVKQTILECLNDAWGSYIHDKHPDGKTNKGRLIVTKLPLWKAPTALLVSKHRVESLPHRGWSLLHTPAASKLDNKEYPPLNPDAQTNEPLNSDDKKSHRLNANAKAFRPSWMPE